MEDQGKRLLLAVALAFGIMLLWQVIFPPDKPEKKPTPEATLETETGNQDKSPETQPDTPPPRGVELVGDESTPKRPDNAQSGVIERDNQCQAEDRANPIVFEFPLFRAEFSRCGGTLASWRLLGDRFYEYKNGARRQLDLVRAGEHVSMRPFSVRFEEVDWDANANWKLEQKTDTEVQFSWQYKVADANGVEHPAFELTKTYRIYPDDYLLEFSIQVKNLASASERQTVVVSLYGYQDPNAKTSGGWSRVNTAWNSACYINGSLSKASAKSLAKGPKKRPGGNLMWAGFDQSYFLFVASPRDDANANHECNSYGVEIDGQPGGMRTDIVYPTTTIGLGEHAIEHTMVAYIGPKYLDELESLSDIVGYDPQFGESVVFPWYAFLARPLLWLLEWFYTFLGNWGLSIIFLTLMVKLATLYWATKSMRSMKAMARLGPQIKALQEKYKHDKARVQQETMALYKAHNVNPLAGCLPILLQMPIWISLYRMLMYAGQLYHAPFIPGWIDDLTGTDPYYILPISLVVIMFVQARLTPSQSNSTQQKMMQYGLPIMFGVFSFFFPAGLTLYILTNTSLSALHHVWMRRTDPHPPTSAGKAQDGKAGGPKNSGRKQSGGRATASAEGHSNEDEHSTTTDDGVDGDSSNDAGAATSQSGPSSRSGKRKSGAGKKSRRQRRGKRNRSSKS